METEIRKAEIRKTEISLLRRAKGDLATCKRNLAHWVDEVEIDIAAYHLQQALEKMLKFKLALQGIPWQFTHDISQLLDHFDTHKISYPHWVDDYSITITQFATMTRYGKNLVASTRVLNKIVPLVEEYLQLLEKEENNETPFSPQNCC